MNAPGQRARCIRAQLVHPPNTPAARHSLHSPASHPTADIQAARPTAPQVLRQTSPAQARPVPSLAEGRCEEAQPRTAARSVQRLLLWAP